MAISQKKLQKIIMMDSLRGRIPDHDNRIHPIVEICSSCKKRKVTNHHFLCDRCWDEKHNKRKGKQ